MKLPLLLTTILLTIAHFSFATQTYHYTFTSNPFQSTITTANQSANLNGRTIYIKSSASATAMFVPGRGLRITAPSAPLNLSIYTKTSDPTLSASITLETQTKISITFNQPNQPTTSAPYDATPGLNTITHSYTDNTLGPKINITIGTQDTIYIRSIEFIFDVTSTAHTIHLYDASSQLITSFPADSTPISLPILTPTDPRFSFSGWTASSITNSPNPPADLTNIITTAPSADIDLHPMMVHHIPASAPSFLTITPSTQSSISISEPLPLPANSLLASLHIHIAGSSSTNLTALFLSSDNIGDTTRIDHTDTKQSRFHKFEVNSYAPSTGTLTLTAHRKDDPLTIDSIVAIYYTQTTPRFYSSIPSFTDSHNLTIDFPRTINPGVSLTAIDAMTYSMTIDDSRYFFISLPFSVPFDNITIEPLSGPHPRTYYYGYDVPNDQYLGDYVISDYDETTRSWRDLELSDLQSTGLLANHGYTIGLTKPSTQATITFRTSNADPDTPYTITTTQPETTLPTPLTNPSDTRNSGWHLIGNPYLTPLSPSSIYTSTNQHLNYVLIPNTTNTSYTILSPYSEHPTTSIPPFTSFFIQSLTDNTIINPTSAADEQATQWDKRSKISSVSDMWLSEQSAASARQRYSKLREENARAKELYFTQRLEQTTPWDTAQRLEQATPWDTTQRPDQATPYHFNIICETPDSITSTLTILSSETFTENYEPGADLKSLSPATDITHDGLAIYASNLTTGDTISITTPDNATLSLGHNILIPDNWTISIEDNNIIISDNTPSSTPDILDNTLEDDPVISIHTIDGRQIPLNATLHHGIYILRHRSGQTSKTLIP